MVFKFSNNKRKANLNNEMLPSHIKLGKTRNFITHTKTDRKLAISWIIGRSINHYCPIIRAPITSENFKSKYTLAL
jgi:hypothetical protein